jgi:hypothetical protein
MPRSPRSRGVQVAVAVVATVGVIGGALAAFTFMRSSETRSETEWLLTHGAQSAQLEIDDSGEAGMLTLQRPDSTVLMFTDRPERRTATIDLASLVDQWSGVFSSSAPNAALVDDATGDAVAVIALGQPELAVDAVTFPVAITELSEDMSERRLVAGVHLFIDPPAARLTDFHEAPMPNFTVPIPHVGGTDSNPGTLPEPPPPGPEE